MYLVPMYLELLVMPNSAYFRLSLVNWSDFHEKKASFQRNGPFL